MTILDHLLASIRSAAAFNSDVQVAPVCILWPDRDRQWESAVPRLQAEMPELFVLGEYAPDKRTGPAIWLRCVLAGQIPDAPVPEGATPVLYLPGFGRQDLRAVESCPDALKPLVELQYRGTRSRGVGSGFVFCGDILDPPQIRGKVLEVGLQGLAHDIEERLLLQKAGLIQRQPAFQPTTPGFA